MSSEKTVTDGSMDLPDELRDAIGKDLRPVRPLAPCWRRLLYVLPVVLLALGVPLITYGFRDWGGFDVLFGWIPVSVQVMLALALLVFALREGIPGQHGCRMKVSLVVLGAYVLQIAVNLAIFFAGPSASGAAPLAMWVQCFRVEALIGVPVLMIIAWLVGRSLPERPLMAGFLAGSGAGFAGDASWRLVCPANDPVHILLGHTGGILMLGLTGFLLGYLWSLYARRTAEQLA